jgi:3-deoxy-D-manno-octulosonic-acid transferase
MGNSLGLSLYLAISRHARGHAARKLERRLADGKEDAGRMAERLGQASEPRPKGTLAWFHAASVGESLSLLELIRRLGDQRPDISFLITTGTRTSADLMAARLPVRAVHQYIPVDVQAAVDGFLDHWQPDIAVWTESEFWPCLIVSTHKRNVPMVLINARMSARSYRRWRWAKSSASQLLNSFSGVLAQDTATEGFLSRLGLTDDRLEVTGTLKEGSAALPHNEAERVRFSGQLDGRPVWLAASTHKGEEAMVAEAHRLASRMTQRLLLLLVPRHPERGDEVARLLQDTGWVVMQRSKGEVPTPETEIYVADTLGELGLWFRTTPVSFIGGSLVDIGGHNPYEPAALGSAILHGPHVENFADIYYRLSLAGAAVEVANPHSLAEAVGEILSPDKAAEMAHAAWEVCSEGAEVTDRVLAVLLRHLPTEEPET